MEDGAGVGVKRIDLSAAPAQLIAMLTLASHINRMVSPFAPDADRLPRWVLALVAGASIAAIPLAALIAQPAARAFTVLETGQSFDTLQQAVDAIGQGSGTIQIAPGAYTQCAIQQAGRIEYRSAQPGGAVLTGTACEGKAALVLRGQGAVVNGIVFNDIQVSDGNGAGIRLEDGTLDVSQSWFRDSQQGILTVNDRDSRMTVDKSTFTRLGTCAGPGGCAHSIYAGTYGEVRVTRSRFEQGRGGHYVKTRAARNFIDQNSFDDTGGKQTNYMVDLPEAGAGSVSNNWFVQGKDKENWSAIIAVGGEGRQYSADGLLIEGNDARLAPGITRNPAFVADWTGDKIVMRNNTLGAGLKPYEKR